MLVPWPCCSCEDRATVNCNLHVCLDSREVVCPHVDRPTAQGYTADVFVAVLSRPALGAGAHTYLVPHAVARHTNSALADGVPGSQFSQAVHSALAVPPFEHSSMQESAQVWQTSASTTVASIRFAARDISRFLCVRISAWCFRIFGTSAVRMVRPGDSADATSPASANRLCGREPR